MASSKEYRDYILELLDLNEDISYKPMMGEYLLYYRGVLFGGIYDDRFLVKKVSHNSKYKMIEVIPYNNAQSMYFVDSEDSELLRDIVKDTYKDLKS